MLNICEACDCKEAATEQIDVKAGKHGTLTLHVCARCVAKFQD